MISGGAQGSSGGRRSLDAEVNLVPFIDLLSMCICFLLMTAVWIQIGSLEVKQAKGTEAPPAGPFELDVRFTAPTNLEIALKRNGKAVKKLSVEAPSADALVAKLDSGLDGAVRSLAGSKDPAVAISSLVSAGMVTPRIGVPYGDLVSVMDVLRKHKIVNLGVVPVSGGG